MTWLTKKEAEFYWPGSTTNLPYPDVSFYLDYGYLCCHYLDYAWYYWDNDYTWVCESFIKNPLGLE